MTMATIDETQTTGVKIQEAEIDELRQHFKDNIRILSSIGQFAYILKIRAEQYDVSLTLQLDHSYPLKIPDILITAPRLIPDQISIVQKVLQSHSESLINQPMVLAIYSRLLRWFDENNIQALSMNIKQAPSSVPTTPRSPAFTKLVSPFALLSNQNRSMQTDSNDSETMKSKIIDTILARIETDPRLDKSLIRVGFIDRSIGLQEKRYQEFDCKFDSSETQDRSALTSIVPKHLIQYFKYGDDIFWDKDKQNDLILDAADSLQTIEDILNRQKNSREMLDSTLNLQNNSLINNESNIRIKHFLTAGDGLAKPNYFLSIPITNRSLIHNYVNTRDNLRSSHSSLFASSSILTYDPAHLHLILLTLRLNSPIQLEQCIQALKRIQEEIHYHCCYPERINLEFQGVKTFFGKIFYVRCQPNPRLNNLRTLIIERLCEQQQKQKMNEFSFAGNYQEFIPHIILFKSKRKIALLPEIDTSETPFGQQTIDALQLSSFDTNENEQQTSHCVFKFDLS